MSNWLFAQKEQLNASLLEDCNTRGQAILGVGTWNRTNGVSHPSSGSVQDRLSHGQVQLRRDYLVGVALAVRQRLVKREYCIANRDGHILAHYRHYPGSSPPSAAGDLRLTSHPSLCKSESHGPTPAAFAVRSTPASTRPT